MWWPFSRKKSDLRNLSIDDFLALSGVPNTGSGEYVSAGTAESLPAVMNAVSVIAEAVATMPCYLYLVRNDKGREAREWLDAYSALFDHGLASKSDQRFASIRSTGNLTFSTAF